MRYKQHKFSQTVFSVFVAVSQLPGHKAVSLLIEYLSSLSLSIICISTILRSDLVVRRTMSGCIDLMPYASSISDLESLTGGGNIVASPPVFFDIPSQVIAGEINYCLENMTIPTNVDGVDCSQSQNCYLSLGLHVSSHFNDGGTDACIDSSSSSSLSSGGETTGCFDCLCTGMTMGTGVVHDETMSRDCGIHTDSGWAVTCGDVSNGRLNWSEEDGQQVESEFSTVHISLCSASKQSGCSLCQGGIHPSFRIGVQWISDLQEQCYNQPFDDGSCSGGLHLASIIGISVGSVLFVAASIALVVVSCRKRKATIANLKDKDTNRCSRSRSSATSSIPREVQTWA